MNMYRLRMLYGKWWIMVDGQPDLPNCGPFDWPGAVVRGKELEGQGYRKESEK